MFLCFHMKALTTLALAILFSLPSALLAQDEPEMNVKDTDWVVISTAKTTSKENQATAKIKIKGAGIKQDCDLWVNLSKFVGTERKHNVARMEPIALTAGADSEHEASFAVPEDAGAIVFSVFTMPTGKTDWADKIQGTEVASKVE